MRYRYPILATVASFAFLVLAGCGGNTSAPAQPKGSIAVHADTVLGTARLPADQAAARACVVNSRFPRGSEVVWRVRVLDGLTGTALNDSAMDTVVVRLSDGQTFPMHFGPHPSKNPVDQFWSIAWEVPADYPTGSVNYTISAKTKDGRTTLYEPFKVAPSLLTITAEVFK